MMPAYREGAKLTLPPIAGSVGLLVGLARERLLRERLGLALVVVARLQDDEVVPIDERDQPMLVVDAT